MSAEATKACAEAAKAGKGARTAGDTQAPVTSGLVCATLKNYDDSLNNHRKTRTTERANSFQVLLEGGGRFLGRMPAVRFSGLRFETRQQPRIRGEPHGDDPATVVRPYRISETFAATSRRLDAQGQLEYIRGAAARAARGGPLLRAPCAESCRALHGRSWILALSDASSHLTVYVVFSLPHALFSSVLRLYMH